MNKTALPNFFIVGAPKCGTTSLQYYLEQHPDVFFAPKELHFFGEDLNIRNHFNDLAKYQSYFANATQKAKGEASVWYLYSQTAPHEIKALVGDAKIIICLRNPVDMIYSLHGENIYNGYETESDFEKALTLEYGRKSGFNIPSSATFNQCLFYKENGLFSAHIERWQQIFGKENVLVVLLDDLKSNALEVTNKTLSFIGVSKLENIDAETQNEAKDFASLGLHQKFKSAKNWEKNLLRLLIPSKKIRERILNKVYQANIKKSAKKTMSPELRNKLTHFYVEDIKATEKLIDRNLNHWMK
ncbi:MAG: sulfotransferase domain-containing protein [Flavobacteriales bacterium]